jgi:hypothetical protein
MKRTIRHKGLLLLFLVCSMATETIAQTTLTTQLSASLCGTTLPELNTPMTANIVAGASAYRFRATTTQPDGSTLVQTYTGVLRVFNLTQLESYAFARTYSIEVAVRIGGVWQPYGSPCTVTSPTPLTGLQTQCGAMLDSMNDLVYAGLVKYAAGYRFKVTNLGNPAEEYILDRPLREFCFNLFPVHAATTYLVRVAVKNPDGTYLPYGPACPVTSPAMMSKIGASYCGRTISTFADYLYAELVPGAQAYRFRVTNLSSGSVEVVQQSNRSFSLTMISDVSYGTGYQIEVSVKDPSGVFGPYGPFCTIFTPIIATPKIQLSQCEMTATTMSELIYADDFPNATAYKFRLYNPQMEYVQTVTRSARYFSLSMFSGLQPNTAYTIKVSAKVNGYYTSYGKACAITTPASASRFAAPDKETAFAPVLYPNPFTETFSIAAGTDREALISVAVYDMTGRLLDRREEKAGALETDGFGTDYPAGVYSAVISYGEETRALRLIKR